MCYHNSVSGKAGELGLRYNATLEDGFDFKPIYHAGGFGLPKWPVMTLENPSILQPMYWGLIPHWIKDAESANEIRTKTLNGVSERIFETPSFKMVILSKRCLIPSTGFIEWREFNGKKYPYWIGVRDEEIFSMAGVYDTWTDKATGEVIQSFSILTIEANEVMAQIHNSKKRMPVILSRENEQKWLNSQLTKNEIQSFLKPYPSNKMVYHPISKLITSRKENPNRVEVSELFNYPELPAIEV